jgi:uncharacterized membrane protein
MRGGQAEGRQSRSLTGDAEGLASWSSHHRVLSGGLAWIGAAAGSLELAWLLIGLGAALRLAQYASGRSLWLDESYLALNVLTKSYSGLVGQLDFAQGAPPGFLIATKLLVDAFGSSEYVLRIIPLGAGLLSLPLFHSVARRALAPATSNLALGLFVVAGGLIRYSSEFKPYEMDVAMTLLLVWAALALPWRTYNLRAGAVFALCGVVALWFSYAAVFVVAGVVTAVLLLAMHRREWRRVVQLVGASAMLLGTFAAVYFLAVRHLDRLQAMFAGDSSYYMPLPPRSLQDLRWFQHAASQLFTDKVALALPASVGLLAALLAIVGAVALTSRCLLLLLTSGATLFFVLLASGLERYPWGGRFTLFLVPFIVLLIAAGIGRLGGGRTGFVPALAAAAAIVALPTALAARHAVEPRTIEEIRPAIEHVRERWRRGDVLYLNFRAQYAFRYYAQYRGLALRPGRSDARIWRVVPAPGGAAGTAPALVPAPPELAVGSLADDEAHGYLRPLHYRLSRTRRVWILLDHLPLPEREALPARVGDFRLVELFRRPGVTLYLYSRR